MQKRILVLDDEQAVRELLVEVLSQQGYRTTAAAEGEAALAAFTTELPHVAFLDLNLPGLSGIQVAQRMRQINPMAILYAMTGYTSLFDLANCRAAGFDDYFPKPFSLSVLLGATRDAFEKIERWRRR